ncbi:MAG: helix-turn-helix transcriptional regulator [Burkholderiaceae bacterium]|nr:helix-turn-helix transcriptional regulator [Burkholderiaceae bacterium]
MLGTMSLGHRIRYYRNKKQWTLEALAEKSDVEVGTINALENRGSERSKFAPAIARAFGLTLEQLLDETRDWLEPALPGLPNVRHVARSTQGQYQVTRWLFSDELFNALQNKRRADLEVVENLVRIHLQMAPLPARPAKHRAA